MIVEKRIGIVVSSKAPPAIGPNIKVLQRRKEEREMNRSNKKKRENRDERKKGKDG